MTPHRAALADELFDHLVANSPTTLDEIQTALGVSRTIAQRALSDLRARLGDSDTINVAAVPNGLRQPWLYSLVACAPDSKWWEANRVVDMHARVETMRSFVQSMLAGLDGRTIDGRGQRLFKAALDNILTTLDAISS